MKHGIIISYVFIITTISIIAISNSGCAVIVPPQGGFRDTIPPVMTKATPADSSVNFKGNRINFSFDEYVKIDNFEQNAIISPLPKNMPRPTNRLNTVTLHIRDTLEPNTTYTIDFGKSIQDVNEGNVMKDFTYTFSTGPSLDSLSFRGNVIVAETGVSDSTLTVMLYKTADDSAVRNERPRYVTKLDGKGNFVFKHLPAGTFYLYALEDNSRSYRYIDYTKLFAFSDSPVVVQKNAAPRTLYAFRAGKPKETSTAPTGKAGAAERRLKFQTNLKNGNTQDLLQHFTVDFDRPLKNFDSTKIQFTRDSSYTPVTGYSWTQDTTKKKITLNYSFAEDTRYHLVFQKDFAADTLGEQLLRVDTIGFKSMKRSDYGKLTIRIRNLDLTKNPVLEFVQNGTVASAFPLTSENFVQQLFLPGEYDLRLLYDANKNGVWDPGKFFGVHKQPELVKPIQRKVIVKEGNDTDIEITAPH